MTVQEPPESTAVRSGFDSAFLRCCELPLAKVSSALESDITPTRVDTDRAVRHYMHFSLQMSKGRRFCRWAAWNLDATPPRSSLPRGGFRFDCEGYTSDEQVGGGIYVDNGFDEGHIARREDLVWGTQQEAQQANVDSMFFTNITPQAWDFNRDRPNDPNKGRWGRLEIAVGDEARTVDDERFSLFGGPVLADTDDYPFMNVLVPRRFWKIVAWSEGGKLRSRGFLLEQVDIEEWGAERLRFEDMSPTIYKRVEDLQQLLEIDFGPRLAAADVLAKASPLVDQAVVWPTPSH